MSRKNKADTDSRLSQVQASFAGDLMRIAVNELKSYPATPWPKLPEKDQQRILDRMRKQFDEAIRAGIAYVLAAGYKHVDVGLDSIAVRGAAKLSVSLTDVTALHAVVDGLGRKAVLVLMDPAMFLEGLDRFVADADQPDLFAEPVDDRPADQVAPAPTPCQSTFVQADQIWGCNFEEGHAGDHEYGRNLAPADRSAEISSSQPSPTGSETIAPPEAHYAALCGESDDFGFCRLVAGHEGDHAFESIVDESVDAPASDTPEHAQLEPND